MDNGRTDEQTDQRTDRQTDRRWGFPPSEKCTLHLTLLWP